MQATPRAASPARDSLQQVGLTVSTPLVPEAGLPDQAELGERVDLRPVVPLGDHQAVGDLEHEAFLTWLGFDSGLPTTTPDLGADVTTLWCGGRTQDSQSYQVWRLTPPDPWQAYRVLAVDIGQA